MAQTALLSAYNKDDQLRDFAQGLIDLGWNLLASEGTRKFLDQYNIASTDVGDLVGPPILGHRVVTLDRKIYAALLARRDNADDLAELKRIGVEPISLVYVDLYPLAKELQNKDCSFRSVVEKTDIGGPTLLRAAAKGGCYTLSNPEQFERVLGFIKTSPDQKHPEGVGDWFLARLNAEAEAVVAEYAALSSLFYKSVADGEFPHAWRRSSANDEFSSTTHPPFPISGGMVKERQ